MPDPELSPTIKYPHTHAFLAALAKEHGHSSIDALFPSEHDDAESWENSRGTVARVAALLDEDKEDDVRVALRDNFGITEIDDLDHATLEIMHRHKDDAASVPFVFLTPTKRPISRPSSRASTHSFRGNRPETPTAASPLAHGLRRPHTPNMASPLAGGQPGSSYISSSSPSASPIPAHASVASFSLSSSANGGSPQSSPVSSPRFLNAKATEFKPIARPHPIASASFLRAQTPSPDLWAHGTSPTNSTLLARGPSNLAIAAPLTPESGYYPRPQMPHSNSSSRVNSSSFKPTHDEEDDEFSPFGQARSMSPLPNYQPGETEGTWASYAHHNPYEGTHYAFDERGYPSPLPFDEDAEFMFGEGDEMAMMSDGMSPLDVLFSVFGDTLARADLEEALLENGYDFDRAMTWLVDKKSPNQQRPIAITAPPVAPKLQSSGSGSGRPMTVPREAFLQGRSGFQNGRSSPRPGAKAAIPGNRVCRYFLNGECRRADCRFSHDVERALCRFWLRNQCAKGDQCEFLHSLPDEVDMSGLSGPMSQVHLDGRLDTPQTQTDDFPTLGGGGGVRSGSSPNSQKGYDPGRTRFAAAVKRPQAAPLPGAAARTTSFSNRTQNIVTPRPSPRIRLRPPSLLPTLPTGESVNSLYLSYRSRAIQLGANRHAILQRASEAWKRGDGAAAKKYSREANDLNAKMAVEAAEAANLLVRERARLATEAVRNREASWTDDPRDRGVRGKIIGGDLGVCLGVASSAVCGSAKSITPEEKTECLLDLHGLHSNEAVEVLELFVLALEREKFLGLAYLVVGEEKHTGTQDPGRGASRARLATGVRDWLFKWGYPWSERDGVVCVDVLTHS